MEIVEECVQLLGSGAPITIRDLSDVSAIENDARVRASKLVQERA